TGTSHVDTTAVVGKNHWYRLRTVVGAHESADSANDQGWRKPPTPTGASASDGTFTDKVQVTWTAVTGATLYTIYRATSSGGVYSSIGTTAGTNFNDMTANEGDDYWYKVSASGPDQEGDQSAFDQGWRAPAPPTNFQASDGTFTDRVRLTWNLVSGATNIKIYRATSSGGPYSLLATVAGASTQYDDTTVTVGVTYWYKASTIKGAGAHEGPQSAADSGYAQNETNPLNTTSTWPKFKSKRDNSGATTANGPSTAVPTPPTYLTNSPIKGSPTMDGSGRVYVGGLDFYLYSLTPTVTGFTLNWRFFTGDYVSSAPAIDTSNILYFGGQNSTLYAMNQNGTTKWAYAVGGAIEGSPTLAGNNAIVGANDGKVYAVNMSTGALAWLANLGGQIRGSPAYANSKVYVGSTNGTLAALNLGDGSVAWSQSLGTPLYSSPALNSAATVLYIGGDDGTLYARNTSDGLSAGSYTPPAPDNASITSSPSVDSSGNIYFGNWAGKVYKLTSALSLAAGWPFVTGDIVESSPSMDAAGNIFFGSWDRYIYGVNGSASQLWRKLTGDIITLSSPAIGPLSGVNRIYIGSYDSKVWAVKQ
ncbi:MAG: PQQ-binding-like beta-propeller repeat protein, partial [bacterium]